MHTSHTQFDIKVIQISWQAFDSMAHMPSIHSKAEYTRMPSLLDAASDDEGHARC